MAPFFLEILDFQFLHVFPRYFNNNNCAIGFLVCKCALVSFYTYFQRIFAFLRGHVRKGPFGVMFFDPRSHFVLHWRLWRHCPQERCDGADGNRVDS